MESNRPDTSISRSAKHSGVLIPPYPVRPVQFNPPGDRAAATITKADRPTMAAKVAAFLKAHPYIWHDGRVFMGIAGSFGWRTRLSDCRRAPFFMAIENRQRRENGYTISEYRYVPPSPERGSAA